MKEYIMNLYRLIPIVFLTYSLSACALSGGPVRGKVLEEGSNKPIPGVIVVVSWEGYVYSLADTHDVCVHVDSTVTDELGGFQFAPWSKPSKVGLVSDLKPKISAYKLGYGYSQLVAQTEEIEYLAPFKGTNAERLEYLWRMRPSCNTQYESERNVLPLLNALYGEAKLIGGDKKSAPNMMSLMETIRYDMEIIELGYEEATRRHLKRP